MVIVDLLRQPWPWYIAGPLIGLLVPALLLLGNKQFGFSANLRHVCAMVPSRVDFFKYDWRKESWNLVFALGTLLGGLTAGVLLQSPEPLQVSAQTAADLNTLGVQVDGQFVPTDLFSWSGLLTLPGSSSWCSGAFW